MRQQGDVNSTPITASLPSGNGTLNRQSLWNSVEMKLFTASQTVRCAKTDCECKIFQPRMNATRQCSGCSHSWVFHVCSKFQNLPPFFGNSLKSSPSLIISLFETMSMALMGCHAIPTRIKILLDRIWSSCRLQVDLTQFLFPFGWTLQDYMRGYMLTDHKGQLRDRWVSCQVEEEALIIQQFLRFLETRHLAHDMLATLEAEKSASQNSLDPRPTPDYLLGPLPHSIASQQEATKQELGEEEKEKAGVTSTPFTTAVLASELSNRFVVAMAAAALTSRMTFSTFPAMPLSVPSLSPTGWSAKGEGGAQISNDTSTVPGLSFPPPPPLLAFATTAMDATDMTGGGFKDSEKTKPLTGIFDLWNIPFDGLSDIKTAHTDHKAEMIPDLDHASDFSTSSTNPTATFAQPSTATTTNNTGDKQHKFLNRKTKTSENRRQQHNGEGNFIFGECKQQSKHGTNGTAAVVVSAPEMNLTGRNKKRVLCTTCKKSFCDKGALKIHYSAVHLREMHKCTIKGCNMWFSSRRSRNRHSANPNPRLHMAHSGKKLPENANIVDDGSGQVTFQRNQMPSTVLNPPIISHFMANTTPATSTITAATPSSPSSPCSTPLNLSDPSLQLSQVLCQAAEAASCSQTSASSEDGGDEGVYISERGEMGQRALGHSNHRSPATEFSAFNLAQSSPSPPSSPPFGGSSAHSEEVKVTGSALMA